MGINLLPEDGKLCSFDCAYCECGLNAQRRPTLPLPAREQVSAALVAKLEEMKEQGVKPDVLTFAGNGEPTLHPHFPEIVDDVIAIRDCYFPEAKISVLSNSTQVGHRAVLEALVKTDNPIMKLDTVSAEYIALLDRPHGTYDVRKIVEALSQVGQKIIIQTMFLCGTVEGKDVDNTGSEYVEPWLEAVGKIRPRQVMIYTIDRETPVPTLRKASPQRLDEIARMVRERGITCSVAY